MLRNPFFLSANIPAEYFCDREKETERLTRLVTNNNNVTLISPRRMGKSGLINHCFRQKAISGHYATLYLDILQTSSLREFVYLFGKAVYDALVPKTSKWITRFFQTIKSLNGKFTVESSTGYPSFNIAIGEIQNPQFTLDEIFQFLVKFEKPVIVAIDEFQQITKYPEKNVEAIFRSHMQQQNNACFIFSGSERHIMTKMFLSYDRPFYQSTSLLVLEPIPEEIYVGFVESQFRKHEKRIEPETIRKVYREFKGYTYYMQKTFNEAFSRLNEDEVCRSEDIRILLMDILDENSVKFRELLSNTPDRQKELLYAIAMEGEAENITSEKFIKKYSLPSSSSVQSAARLLLEKDYVTRIDGKFSLTDKFFSLWIKRMYGSNLSLLD